MKTKKKVYGANQYKSYSIHKSTLVSMNPIASCDMMKRIFKSAISGCQSPPDPALAKRGIRWVRFLHGANAEFHFIPPPFSLKHASWAKELTKHHSDPLKSQLFENHVGFYVPDLTPVVLAVLDMKRTCHLNQRADGMYQFYFQIDGCVDFVEADSTTISMRTIHNKHPSFQSNSFAENTNLIADNVVYMDQKHNASRTVKYRGNKVSITGRDPTSWKASGSMVSDDSFRVDFRSKGGPQLTAKRTPSGIRFSDGNTWKAVRASFSS